MKMSFKRIKLNRRSLASTLIDNQVIQTSYTSDSVRVEEYRGFVLYLDINSTGEPTDIVFDVKFSDDNVNWYRLTDWYYDDLRYTDTQTAAGVKEAMTWRTVGRYIRLTATVTGGSAAAYFTVTAKMEFYN